MIILSKETLKGGKLINDKRISNGLKTLEILPVPLLEEDKSTIDCCEDEEQKISSSKYRMRLLGTLLKPPKVNTKNKTAFLTIFNSLLCIMNIFTC